MRKVWDAIEACLIPLPWHHHIMPPGEWQLTALVHRLGLSLQTYAVQQSHAGQPLPAEWHTSAEKVPHLPIPVVAAESWRAIAEAAVDRWWSYSHGAALKSSLQYVLAREHTLRGIPRIRRGSGAGELLEVPIRSDTPIEERGVSVEWLSAFAMWMVESRLFKLPVRVLVEAFVQLITLEHGGCALFDFIPPAFRAVPQIFACHAFDDDVFSLLAALSAPRVAPWISFVAVGSGEIYPSRVAVCVAACPLGVLVCLGGRGEPHEALRPLLRLWCLLEICTAPEPDQSGVANSTDPYAPAAPLPKLRFALGGIDEDVERHRAFVSALDALSSEHALASDELAATEIKRLLRDGHGGYGSVDAKVRELGRGAFFAYYRQPRHAFIRSLYAPRASDQMGLECQAPFAGLILKGTKSIETRAYRLPPQLLGRPLLLIETEEGAPGVTALPNVVPAGWAGARVKGTVVFGACIEYSSREKWDADADRHLVPSGSPYDFVEGGVKFGWVVERVERLAASQPVPEMRRRLRSLFAISLQSGS